MHRAFTLIETLIVMLMVAILIAQLLPALHLVREAAHDMRQTSNMRQHAAVFAMYTTDHKDRYPFYGDPRANLHLLRCGSKPFVVRGYFTLTFYWPRALGDQYYDSLCEGELFSDRRDAGSGMIAASYRYSSSFLAAPEYWHPTTRRTPPRQMRQIRASEVLSPARKAILVYRDYWNRSIGRLNMLAMVDGAAGIYPAALVTTPYNDGDWDGAVSPHFGVPGHQTLYGVRGFDLKE